VKIGIVFYIRKAKCFMAEPNEDQNRGESEPSGHRNKDTHKVRYPISGVNFDEMNFEQRRAPYNSGRRNIADRQYDQKDKESDGEHTRNEP
jgi:hypothetical protein